MNEIDLDKIDMMGSPPEHEPERQYYFMAKCREWVREFEQKNGRYPLACIQTFGCQMNAKDSEKLSGILTTIGYVVTDTEKADFVLYNTCTVRENANTRVYGRIGYLGRIKRKENPGMKIALCGCMMQEEHVVAKIQHSYPFVDLIFGTHNIYKLAELLYRQINAGGMVVEIEQESREIVEELPSELKYGFKAGVNIMYGCNNFCSYCIVPYVRGRERSRRAVDIIQEMEELAKNGVTEVMLLGQNVNSYGKTLETPVSFAELLQRAEQVEGIRRIRFMTPHPKDLSDELIDVMAKSKKICHHLHLPLQSGSTRILEKMNRRYTKDSYLALAEKIRREIPDISLTTDIIVGFPGETGEDAEDTIDVIRKVQFDNAFTFVYSRRTGTPAAAMEQVPEDKVRENFDRILACVQETARERVKRFEGQTLPVLVEEINEQDASFVTGRLSNNTVVHFAGDSSLIGRIVDVKLKRCEGFYYIGELMS